MKEVIFTDLDGTLIDHNTYSFEKARPALELLREQNIPLVICTSKTRAEIEIYRKKLKNKDPFISENGGAIFIPKGYFKKKFKYSREIRGYYIIELGTSYSKLIQILKTIEAKTKADIIGFNEMSLKDLVMDSGLKKEEAKLAMKREYDEAFKLMGTEKQKKKVLKSIKRKGLNYTIGGRYYHLMGDNNKGKALKILKRLYENEINEKVKTIALGDSLNDKPMFDRVDKSFLVQKPGKFYAKIKSKNLSKIKGVGPEGWNHAILSTFLKINSERAERIYKKSVEVLKQLQLPNGAILASLPNSRYPYVYPRDHSICILALIESRELKRAKKALKFILGTQNKDGSFPQRLTKEGKDASYKPIQLDNTGLVLYSFAKYIKKTKDKRFLKKQKKKIKKAISYILSQLDEDKNLFFTPNSIHEFPPFEEGLEVWANGTCYGALQELEDIGIKSGIKINKIKKSINKYFWSGEYFIKTIRVRESSSVAKEPDISAYALAEFGVFDNDHKKIKATVKKIEKELTHPRLGGICRYKRHVGRNNGGYGPWPHFTLMICKHYIKLGQKKQADRYLKWVLDISYKCLLPEHIASREGFERWVKIYKNAGIMRKDREIMLKNVRKSEPYKRGLAYSVLPLGWPHAEFIRTWLLYKKRFGVK